MWFDPLDFFQDLFEDSNFQLLMRQMFDWTRNIRTYQMICVSHFSF
jgi:hypothetical protein